MKKYLLTVIGILSVFSIVYFAFIKDGDIVRIDTVKRTLDLLVDPAELEARKIGWEPLKHKYTRGVLAKFSKLVGSASKGAVCE